MKINLKKAVLAGVVGRIVIKVFSKRSSLYKNISSFYRQEPNPMKVWRGPFMPFFIRQS